MKKKIQKLVQNKVVVLDGACGTELFKRGMPAGVSPELWCIKHPEILSSVHADYAASGSDIVYTCTFGANRLKMSQYGSDDVFGVNQKLSQLARKSVSAKTLVAGDIGPTGEFVKPFGKLNFEEAVDIFKEQAKGLLAGGVDLFVVETMMDIQEARAALIAVKETCDLFTIVTMTYEKEGRTLNGTDPLSALITLQSLGADAVGCNCSSGPQDMLRFIKEMKPYATIPLVAKPNAGLPKLVNGQAHFDMDASGFGSWGKRLAFAGANFVGGCCGSSPEHILKLKQSVRHIKPRPAMRQNLAAASSARTNLIFEKKGFWLIGERLNPTGKKKVQEEILAGQYGFVHTLAREQEKNGAKLLDVNVGVPGVDEEKAMLDVLSVLSVASQLPLVIDSSNAKVLEAALRIYPGRAVINSISGEKEKMPRLLELARKYGAMFVLLPIMGKTVPKNMAERKSIIRTLMRKIHVAGLPESNVIVDGLAMTISFDPQAAVKTLETLKWCSKKLGLKTVIGLSNISFGMPARNLINHTFLKLAKKAGLTFAIADPAVLTPTHSKTAENLLLGKDAAGKIFLAEQSNAQTSPAKEIEPSAGPGGTNNIYDTVLEGNRERIVELVRQAVAEGKAPIDLIQKEMIPAIIKAGEFFDEKKYFLPQLIASAETMKKGFEFLKPFLKQEDQKRNFKGLILMATVKNDIHDIGKNIVTLMLSNHGFEVVDLGKDVSTKKIVAEIKRCKPDLVGLSALMTTTMTNMKETIEETKKEGLAARFMVGGAAVTQNYADTLGADYARDGVAAVRIAEKVVGRKAV